MQRRRIDSRKRREHRGDALAKRDHAAVEQCQRLPRAALGRCGGCHMKLVASTVIKVQGGKEIAQCEDCGRILYAD